jgi:hypothetical protein
MGSEDACEYNDGDNRTHRKITVGIYLDSILIVCDGGQSRWGPNLGDGAVSGWFASPETRFVTQSGKIAG